MTRKPASLPARVTRVTVVAALLSIVLAVTGFEASVHGHVPMRDGWHDDTPHGAAARDEGLGSCSMCRLAHETASGPVTPGTVAEPLRLIAHRSDDRVDLDLAHAALEHSPRAPPRPTPC